MKMWRFFIDYGQSGNRQALASRVCQVGKADALGKWHEKSTLRQKPESVLPAHHGFSFAPTGSAGALRYFGHDLFRGHGRDAGGIHSPARLQLIFQDQAGCHCGGQFPPARAHAAQPAFLPSRSKTTLERFLNSSERIEKTTSIVSAAYSLAATVGVNERLKLPKLTSTGLPCVAITCLTLKFLVSP